MNAQGGEQIARRFQDRWGIVIARSENQRSLGPAPQFGEEAVVKREGALGRVGGVEDVPGDDDGIDVMAAHGIDEEREEATMFFVPGEIPEGLAEVPIRRVEDSEIGRKLGGNLIEQVDALTSPEMGVLQVK